jgi:serine phosphatase RsbU (regulator of sigma subunit)/anti-sigma regulatory factor (Ser/Thr protein kinase)
LPLVSQGELIGLLNLGPRLSEQEYSSDDRRLLNNLATQASPALRVAQLARQQLAEAQERERLEHELRVARVIQETLLPNELPSLDGWQVAAHWQPAREVSGDFYDFIQLPEGRLGILIADVTDKGVPAALVMATTRTLLRAVAERLIQPSLVLERVNNLLVPDIPQNMFVTCLYVVLDPQSGKIRFANAGHNLPYLQTAQGVVELRATGMPLGLMHDMTYDEQEATISSGENILLSSDGLVEAHNSSRDMYGLKRLENMLARQSGCTSILFLMADLAEFTGPDYEQEDDITLVILERDPIYPEEDRSVGEEWKMLAEFSIPSEPGNERQAAQQVVNAVQELNLPQFNLEKFKTAVAEATMNAMEHGNQYQAEIPVSIQVLKSEMAVAVRITDQGGGQTIPEAQTPDLDAKLAGEQSPRGWGLFLIKNMVDEMNITSDEDHHTIELIVKLKGDDNDQATL